MSEDHRAPDEHHAPEEHQAAEGRSDQGLTGAFMNGETRGPATALTAAQARRAEKRSRGGRVDVFGADEQADAPVETRRWVRLASSILEAEGVRDDVEASLLFVDETAMAALNQRFLGRSGPTDVLAFPIDDDVYEGPRSADSLGPGPGADPDLADLPTILGDVVVCPAVARRNAPTHAGTYDDELALLVVHGILHLLGLDHARPDEAEKMERREQELLERFHRQ